MSSAFNLEGSSLLPGVSDADVAAAADPASGQKRPRPEGGETVSDQKRLRTSQSSTTESVRRGEKRLRTDDDNNSEQTASGQKRAKSDVQEDEEDARSDGGKTTKTSTSVDSGIAILPISFAPGKVPVCVYCNKRADTTSPLLGSSPDDAYGGLLPWNDYTKYPDGHGDDPTPFKKPSGARCGICGQVYATSGMATQHGKLVEYKKNVLDKQSDDNTAAHKVFLKMRVCWIDQYNVEHKTAFGKKKMALALAGQSKVKSRYVEVRKEMKTSVGGRERNFIEKEHWDEKLDGKYDSSKEVTEFLQGKSRKGCWKWIGRAGVWKGTTEESTTIVDAHVEESGCGGLVENAADVKANTLKTGLLAMEAERDTHSVEAPVLGFDDLLSLAGFNQEAPLLGGMPGEAEEGGVEEQAAADAEEGVPENSDESESSQDDKARCSGYFAVPGATASGRIAKGVAPKAAPTKALLIRPRARLQRPRPRARVQNPKPSKPV